MTNYYPTTLFALLILTIALRYYPDMKTLIQKCLSRIKTNYRINKYIKNTLYKNETFKKNRWSTTKRLMMWGSEHFVWSTVGLLIIPSIVCIVISTKYDWFRQILPLSQHGFSSIIEFQPTIFIAQITLLGLIHPIVIAFIGILLQGKSSYESIWVIYRQHSGFMLVNISALAFSIVFVGFKLIEPWVPHQINVAASMSLTNWISFNLFLSGWFLLKTVNFITTNSQMAIIVSYAINKVIPDHMRKKLQKKYSPDSIKTTSDSLDIEDIIDALLSQIEDSLNNNNPRLFELETNNLIQSQTEIEFLMFFINQKTLNNPLNLDSLNDPLDLDFWNDSLNFNAFNKKYSNISKTVTHKIPIDASYYETWCDCYPWLLNKRSEVIHNETIYPIQITQSHITSHYFSWKELMVWMKSLNSNDLSTMSQREHLIKHFIGSWENGLVVLKKHSKSLNENFDEFVRHLNATNYMLMNALKHGNIDAARLTIDVLILWYNRLLDPYNLDSLPSNNDFYSPHEILDECKKESKIKDYQIKSCALRNYWIDIRCLAAAYLLQSNNYHIDDNYKEFVNALLYENLSEKQVNILTNFTPSLNAQDILGVFLRHNPYLNNRPNNYSVTFRDHLQSLLSIEKSEKILGRDYVESKPKVNEYMSKFFNVVGIGLTTTPFNLDKKWLLFLQSDHIKHYALEKTIKGLKSLTDIDSSMIALVSRQFYIDEKESQRRKDLFVKSIDAIIHDLKDHRKSSNNNSPA